MALTFFSQNDNRWKNKYLGSSKSKVGGYGCTITSCACLGSWFNEIRTPLELASALNFTSTGLLYWKSIDKVYKKMRFEWRFYTFDKALIEKALADPDKVVLLQVDRGYHWVALVGKVLGQYRAVDPYPFPTKTRLYKASDIVGGAILTRDVV